MTETEYLFDLLKAGVSPVHVVLSCERRLKEAGFTRIYYEDSWELVPGGRYYMVHHDTTLFAFTLGEETAAAAQPEAAVLQGTKATAQPEASARRGSRAPQIRMAAAHTDFPCLRIKPSPDVTSNGYAQVNVEVYGGAILNTWLDRPLGVAGRIAVRGENPFEPRVIPYVSEKSLLTIPNLAIHMNREVNKGVELNKQTDLLPVAALLTKEQKEGDFLSWLAEEISVPKEDILDYELTVYCREEPEFTGLHDEFISAPRLDNLTSCAALVSAIISAKQTNGIRLIALFDHEEIGSRTKQGAGSLLLHDLLLRILSETGKEKEAQRDLYQSMLLSVDVAHATHPNQPGKTDLTNKPVPGRGVCIKEASAQSYATDCEAVAIVQQICEAGNIPYQRFVNRSDIPGGGTLGAIASALVPAKTVDIGVPMLAMHSARELMGRADQEALAALVKEFFVR